MERTVKSSNRWFLRAMALLLCAALMLAGVALFVSERASADVDEEVAQRVIVSDSIVNRGQEFDVDIDIANNETGMHAMRLLITYNTQHLTLVGYQAKKPEGKNWSGNFKAANIDVFGGYTTYGTAEKPFVLLWDSTSKLYGNGTIVTLTFVSSSEATVGGDYAIHVEVDGRNTMMTYGKTCSPEVSGGAITMRPGMYSIFLEKADAEEDDEPYAYLDSNNLELVTIASTLGSKEPPAKAATDKYTYTFRGWREVFTQDTDELNRRYKPTYNETPVPYEITFRQGILKQNETVVDYDDADIATFLGEEYAYANAAVTVPYGTIIVFEDYLPTPNYEVHGEYTFLGWYTDEACETAVDFATMPARNVTVYGCYKFNADPADLTNTKFAIESKIEGEYLYATLLVTENFGFNSVRFALDYDEDILEFLGFLYESDGDLYAEVSPTFPIINDAIKAGAEVKDVWQSVQAGYTLAGKHFLFENAAGNAYSSAAVSATGKLITFKFALKADTTAEDATVGITIGDKDLTRYVGNGSTWYANATVSPLTVSIVRAKKPTAYADAATHFVFQGTDTPIAYAFAEAGDSSYYTVENGSRTLVGTYSGENAVKIELLSSDDTFYTWTDGTTEGLSFDFVIVPMQITIPAEDETNYIYNTLEQEYHVVKNAAYYTVTGDKLTDATTQNVTITLLDMANTTWTDGTTDPIVYPFTIHKKEITAPTQNEVSFGYDGEAHFLTFTFAEGEADYCIVSDNDPRTEAKAEYVVTVTLAHPTNTVWKDAEEGKETAALTYSYAITPMKLAKPVSKANVTYLYNGQTQNYLFDQSEVEIDPDLISILYDKDPRVNAGEYIAYAHLIDADNYCWADDSVADVAYPYEVEKITVSVPLVSDIQYNGTTQCAPALTGDELYEITENAGGVSCGEYTVRYAFKEGVFTNYKWSGLNTEYVDVTYHIVPTANAWVSVPTAVEGKEYDGTPIAFDAAEALYGNDTLQILYRAATDEEYTDVAPINAGDYFVRFIVAGTDDYGVLYSDPIAFTITKVKLTVPEAKEKSYAYTGAPQSFEFVEDSLEDQEYYTIDGNVQTNAKDAYTVTVSIDDKDNYEWTTGGTENKTFPFVIAQKKIAIPAVSPSTVSYVYNGETQDYLFDQSEIEIDFEVVEIIYSSDERVNAGDYVAYAHLKSANYCWSDGETADKDYPYMIAREQVTPPTAAGDAVYVYTGEEIEFAFLELGSEDLYELSGTTQTEVGNHTVIATLPNENDIYNYCWSDGSTEAKEYAFVIRYASLTAYTAGEDPYTVTLSSTSGLGVDAELSVAEAVPDLAALLADLAARAKVGALGQLTSEEAAALAQNKCVVAVLAMNFTEGVGSYTLEITLPAARSGLVAVRRVGEDLVEVFKTTSSGERTISFDTDKVGVILLLADHVFDREVVAEEYLKAAATCEEKAVYYKSCVCGLSSEDFGGDTFTAGDALGHDYDFENIVWIWSEDHLSATAKITCLRDAEHVLSISASVTVTGVAPTVTEAGYADYVASFTESGVKYSSDPVRVELPATGHVFTNPPAWSWQENGDSYLVKATFTCDCGEESVALDADVTVDVQTARIVYTARVLFESTFYTSVREIVRPVVTFDFNDRITPERSALMLPGDLVTFPADEDIPVRADYVFVGWRNENGTLIIKGADGVYPEYRIGFARVNFTAVWRSFATVNVRVHDDAGTPIEGASVYLYENDVKVFETVTGANGIVLFEKVPYGNYRLVVEYPYLSGARIVRTDGLDVDESKVTVDLVIPTTNFNTVVEGVGTSEGLDGAISDEEKASIKEGGSAGTITKVVVTQKRVTDVSDEIKQEIVARMNQDDPSGRSVMTDFYDVTIIKTTTSKQAGGATIEEEENIKVAENYQTNIFPLTDLIRDELAQFDGNADNVFVYKRHVYDTGYVLIYNLQKVTEKEGRNADYECFYIKRVAGTEYVAIRQKEYSVLALGVSPDPILLSNEITTLVLADWTFGGSPSVPAVAAKYGVATVKYSYSTEEHGEYTSVRPKDAGTYYMKAFIPATEQYAAAEKVISFKIHKKVVARPQADQTVFVYNGNEQVYRIDTNADYRVSGEKKTAAGSYVVTVSLADPANMIWDSGLDSDLSFDFVINGKKLSDVDTISFKDRTFWFNGKAHSIEICGDLPEGVTVTYSGNGESFLGKYVVTATFKSTNPNYEVSEPMTATMTIRLNWIPIAIAIAVVLTILIIVIVIVEKMLKEEKERSSEEGAKK